MSTVKPDPYRDLDKAYAAEIGSRLPRTDAKHVRTGSTASNRTPVPRPGRDWTMIRRCPECLGPVYALKRENDYVEQTEHRPACSLLRGDV